MMRFIVCFTMVVLAARAGSLRAESLPLDQPNIVLVMTDDQGFGPIGRNGHPWIETPNLDQLYDTSTRFTHFYVCPTCAPTRSALMTGRHPLKNGVTHTIFERERLTLNAVTLPEILRSVGYTTAIFGKWHLGDEEAYQPQNRGFDETFIHGGGGIGQVFEGSCADAPGNNYFDPVIRHNGQFVKTSGFCTDVFFDAALGWIKARCEHNSSQRRQPFFAYIATNAPHAPYHAPPKNVERFKALGFPDEAAGFYGMIENIDDNVGRLMSKLEEWHLLEKTIIIFLSDNGMASFVGIKPGDRLGRQPEGTPMLSYNAGMKGLKGSVDEGGTRVPCFVRWDGHFKPGRDITLIAAHIDILPTLAEVGGADVLTEQVEGRSLVPLLLDEKSTWSDRFLFNHRGRWEVGAEPNDHQWINFSVRNQQFRLVGEDQLYDIELDPGQRTNVAKEYPEIVQAMKSAYAEFWQAARPLMVNEGVGLSKSHPFHDDYYRQEKDSGIPRWNKPSL